MLNVVMLNVVILNVIMLNVVMLNVVMLNVVAPYVNISNENFEEKKSEFLSLKNLGREGTRGYSGQF